MAALPHTTPEGYKLLIYRLANYDPSKMVFADAVKAFCMFNDVRLSEDGKKITFFCLTSFTNS